MPLATSSHWKDQNFDERQDPNLTRILAEIGTSAHEDDEDGWLSESTLRFGNQYEEDGVHTPRSPTRPQRRLTSQYPQDQWSLPFRIGSNRPSLRSGRSSTGNSTHQANKPTVSEPPATGTKSNRRRQLRPKISFQRRTGSWTVRKRTDKASKQVDTSSTTRNEDYDPHKSPILSWRQSLEVRSSSNGMIFLNDGDFEVDFTYYNSAESAEDIRTCRIIFENDMKRFMETELNPHHSISDLVVLTGNVYEGQPWATTCGEFVEQTWANRSQSILSMFELILDEQEAHRSRSVSVNSPEAPLVITAKTIDSKTCVEMFGAVGDMVDFAKALAWLSSLCTTGNNGPVASGSSLQFQPGSDLEKATFVVTNDIHEPLLQAGHRLSDNCWTPLFPRSACSIEFDGKPRPSGVHGLEISFDLMCFTCGLDYSVVDSGGIVLYGSRSVVYPVRFEDNGRTCLQWHFEPSDGLNHDPVGALPKSSHESQARLMVKDLDQLRSTPRHFLGFWSDAVITLGGSDICGENGIKESQAQEVTRERVLDSESFGAQASIPKVGALTYNRNFKTLKTCRQQFISDFEQDMANKIHVPVLLYSPGEQRAFLVSYVSIIHHIARYRAWRHQGLGYKVPAVNDPELVSNGGKASFDCLMSCYGLPLKAGKQDRTIEAFIKEIIGSMEQIRRQSSRVKKFFSSRMVGFELENIANEEADLKMKSVKFAKGWSPILDEVHYLLFYEGLEDPIIAGKNKEDDLRSSRFCTSSKLKKVPMGFNLLTASVPCLITLIPDMCDRAGRVTRDYQCHCTGRRNILEPCSIEGRHVCDLLLTFKKVKKGTHIRSPKIRLSLAQKGGAVVFRYDKSMREIMEDINEKSRKGPTKRGRPSQLKPQSCGYDGSSTTRSTSLSSRDSSRDSAGRHTWDDTDGSEHLFEEKPDVGTQSDRRPNTRQQEDQESGNAPEQVYGLNNDDLEVGDPSLAFTGRGEEGEGKDVEVQNSDFDDGDPDNAITSRLDSDRGYPLDIVPTSPIEEHLLAADHYYEDRSEDYATSPTEQDIAMPETTSTGRSHHRRRRRRRRRRHVHSSPTRSHHPSADGYESVESDSDRETRSYGGHPRTRVPRGVRRVHHSGVHLTSNRGGPIPGFRERVKRLLGYYS